MAVFGGITQAQVTAAAQQRLMAHRQALEGCNDFYQWLSAYSSSDLVALGFSSADASSILTAFADAHEEYVLHTGGGLGSYTLPYNFSASQNTLIGPNF